MPPLHGWLGIPPPHKPPVLVALLAKKSLLLPSIFNVNTPRPPRSLSSSFTTQDAVPEFSIKSSRRLLLANVDEKLLQSESMLLSNV